MRIIAHRCRGFGAAENTLEAMRRALASEVDEIEIDLQATKDRELVMMHNPWFRRGRRLHYVSTLTRGQLRKSKHAIASFDDILDLSAAEGRGKTIILDVKPTGFEAAIIAEIRRRRLKGIRIASWIPSSIQKLHTIAPDVPLDFSFVPFPRIGAGIRCEIKSPHPNKNIIYVNDITHHNGARHQGAMHNHYLSHVPRLPVQRVNLLPPWRVGRRIVEEAHALGMEVCVVNCDSERCARRLERLGVDAIMTNKPEKFLRKA